MTEEEFLQAELDEWGFDYLDEMFARGEVPTQINGVWVWRPIEVSVTPASANSSTIPYTPVNLVVTIN